MLLGIRKCVGFNMFPMRVFFSPFPPDVRRTTCFLGRADQTLTTSALHWVDLMMSTITKKTTRHEMTNREVSFSLELWNVSLLIVFKWDCVAFSPFLLLIQTFSTCQPPFLAGEILMRILIFRFLFRYLHFAIDILIFISIFIFCYLYFDIFISPWYPSLILVANTFVLQTCFWFSLKGSRCKSNYLGGGNFWNWFRFISRCWLRQRQVMTIRISLEPIVSSHLNQ